MLSNFGADSPSGCLTSCWERGWQTRGYDSSGQYDYLIIYVLLTPLPRLRYPEHGTWLTCWFPILLLRWLCPVLDGMPKDLLVEHPRTWRVYICIGKVNVKTLLVQVMDVNFRGKRAHPWLGCSRFTLCTCVTAKVVGAGYKTHFLV